MPLIIVAAGMITGLAAALFASRSQETARTIDQKVARELDARPVVERFLRSHGRRSMIGLTILTAGFLTVSGLTFFTGLLLDMVDDGYGFARLDRSVAEFGLQNADSFLIRFAAVVTDLGGTPLITVLTVVVAAWGWWRWRNPHVVWFMITVSAGQAVVNNGLKWLVDRDRPNLAQLADWSGSSFPSGHSAAAAAFYAAAAFVLTIGASRSVRIAGAGLAGFVAASVAASRALLGVHWLTDVLAGLAIGGAWFVVALLVFGGRIMRFGSAGERLTVARSTGGTDVSG